MEPPLELAGFTPEEKRRWLYEKQKAMLETFLETGAISPEQFQKSLGDLSRKMGFDATVKSAEECFLPDSQKRSNR